MRRRITLTLASIALAAAARGQQAPQSAPAAPPARPSPLVGMQATPVPEILAIYQIDLEPSGTGFALGQPVLEGDVYVFKAWPDRAVVRLAKSKVKKITQRTKDINQEVVYRIDLLPSGRMIARENPVLKGTSYTFRTWRDGTLMSLRKADVKQIVKVTGIPAFRIQQEERGAALNANLPMEGGGDVTILPGGPDTSTQTQAAPQQPPPGQWGYPAGISEANPPPSAVVERPGDVPKAAPAPTPHP